MRPNPRAAATVHLGLLQPLLTVLRTLSATLRSRPVLRSCVVSAMIGAGSAAWMIRLILRSA